MTSWLTITQGDAPLIVSVPHAGAEIPPEFTGAFVSLARARFDADFHVDRLYEFAGALNATVITTAISRAVIDVNRDPSGASLYPGQATTELCPTIGFDGTPLYQTGRAPSPAEIAERRARYFEPYHQAIADEIGRLRALHPAVVLYDAHSIRSHVPRLFEGELPEFNIGTFNGKSCAPDLEASVAAICRDAGTTVVNGRFKGGWITRHYGAPERGIHAIQMELAMKHYLDEEGPWPPKWDSARAAPLQATLQNVLAACLTFAREN